MEEGETRTFIYTSPMLKNMYTIYPMAKFPSDTYVSLEAVKNCLEEDTFNELKLRLRGYKCKIINTKDDGENKI